MNPFINCFCFLFKFLLHLFILCMDVCIPFCVCVGVGFKGHGFYTLDAEDSKQESVFLLPQVGLRD